MIVHLNHSQEKGPCIVHAHGHICLSKCWTHSTYISATSFPSCHQHRSVYEYLWSLAKKQVELKYSEIGLWKYWHIACSDSYRVELLTHVLLCKLLQAYSHKPCGFIQYWNTKYKAYVHIWPYSTSSNTRSILLVHRKMKMSRRLFYQIS